jgi:predicted DNA-binding transcriptional regulator AlpA
VTPNLVLTELLANPARALELSPAEAAGLLARLEGLSAVVRVAAAAQGTADRVSEPPDRLLTAEELTQRLGLSRKQIYRRAHRWPFTRRPSKGTLRFSERALEKWMARNPVDHTAV